MPSSHGELYPRPDQTSEPDSITQAELDSLLRAEPSGLSVDEKLLLEITYSPDKRITYAQFMEMSLYDKEDGYYASGKARIGSGDFVTAPTIHPAFGVCMANNLHDLWTEMDQPDTFDIVEQGAGTGTLARDVLAKLEQSYPWLYDRMRYTIIERSGGLIPKQRETVGARSVHWIHGSAVDTPIRDIEGVFLSNELPDAFAVHNLTRINGEVKEIYVTVNGKAEFVEINGEVSPEVNDSLYTDQVAEGQRVAVSPVLVQWQQSIGKALKRGFVVTVDYFAMDPAENPSAYLPRTYGAPSSWNHMAENAFKYPGQVDITTSVNRPLMLAAGARSGLKLVSDEVQKDFLLRNGLDEEIARINNMHAYGIDREYASQSKSHIILRRGAIALNSMGRDFAVITQSKNLNTITPKSIR
jgi:SAM-dependent MidA family methyltransferase